MQSVDLPLEKLKEADWNPNHMDEAMQLRLAESVRRYGLVESLVVRPIEDGRYEVIGGNQRLKLLRSMGFKTVPCVVVNLDNANARLLAQALNRIQGEDDLGLRAELVRKVLETIAEDEVRAVLPDTPGSLEALASMGRQTMAEYLVSWQKAQEARLKHFQFQITTGQQKVVEEALARIMPRARREKGDSPNARGTALYLLCKQYLEKEPKE